MPSRADPANLRINRCTCPTCQRPGEHPDKTLHQQINLLMSVMNVRQRRMFAAFQAQQWGRGGVARIVEITGLDRKTVRRGMREIEQDGKLSAHMT